MNRLETLYAEAVRTHRLSASQAMMLHRAMAGGWVTYGDGRKVQTARSLERKGLVVLEDRIDSRGHLLPGFKVRPVEDLT